MTYNLNYTSEDLLTKVFFKPNKRKKIDEDYWKVQKKIKELIKS